MVLPQPVIITGNTIGETHDRIIAALIIEGCNNELQTEDNEYTWEYPSQVIAHVRYPSLEPFKSDASPFSRPYIDEYRLQMRSLTPPRADGKGFTYTYGNRILDYPTIRSDGTIQGDGRGQGINQLFISVIDRLVKQPSSRRAVVVTWCPALDIGEGDPPCIDVIQFMLRDEIVSLTAYIRSNDMLLAWPNNVYGLSGILDSVTSAIDAATDGQKNPISGSITTISTSAHIYPVRDANYLRRQQEHLMKIGLLR